MGIKIQIYWSKRVALDILII